MKTYSEDIKIVSINDSCYPEILRHIPNPPPTLYVNGNLEYDPERSLSIVGARNHSPYGKEVTEPIVRDLLRYGFTIVSGMAIGIDSIAHRSALRAGGKTIAVLGSGIDGESIYPPQNRGLAREIIESGGAVISEFSPGTKPLRHHFLQRNRVVSGLTRGALVIEAREKSGALSTANHALEQGKDVFAIPGPIFAKHSRGTNNLIKMGAKLVTSAQDILEEFNIDTGSLDKKFVISGSEEEKAILKLLYEAGRGLHIDDIIKHTRIEPRKMSSLLTMMEIDGRVMNLGAGIYTIKR